VFIALALLFAPVHTTLHHGQTPLYVMAFMLPALVIDARRQALAGMLLGFAAAIKPQIGLPAVALEAVRNRWRSVMVSAAIMLAIAMASAGVMTLQGIPWLSSWRANLAAHRATGAGDLSAANADRHQLVNLQYPLTALTDSKHVAEIGTLAICAVLAAAFFLPPRQRMAATPLLMSASMVTVLTLMVTYHRFYDAVLLLAPLAWALDAVAGRPAAHPAGGHRLAGWCTLALLVPFLLNSATALHWLSKNDRLPAWIDGGWAFERLILPHQGWALLGMAVCLLMAQPRSASKLGAEPSVQR
jgi:hypothetical protein